jgi:hypothetical protein
MAWSGGTFTRVHDWTTDEAGAINIEAARMDAEDDGFATGIDSCLHKAGQNAATGNLPMGTNRHTGVGNSQALTDYASSEDVIDQHLLYYVDSGAADAYVITPSPAITAYAEGQRFVFRATNASTGASTLNVNALGAITIETNDAVAIAANMIAVGGYYEVTYDANGSRFVLTSPHSVTPAATSTNIIAGTGLTGGGTLAADRTLNVIGGAGIDANANDIALTDYAGASNNPVVISSGAFSYSHAVLSATTAAALDADDTIIVSVDGDARKLQVQEIGMRSQTAQTTQTLAAADMNSIMEFTATSTLTLPLNATTALPIGVPVVLNVKHATQVLTVTAAPSVTLVSIFHPGGGSAASDTVVAGGTALLYKTATDVWALAGDIAT